jgi:hypothetical protein
MTASADRAYVYLVEPNRDFALIGWQAALAGRESSRANVVLLGDAKVEGYPTTDFSRTSAQELARALRAKFPTPGLGNSGGRGRVGVPSQGLSPALPTPLTFHGGTFDPVAYNITPTFHFGADHTCWYTNTQNHNFEFTLEEHETSFDLVHVVGPTGHTSAGYYKVNGGPAIAFSTHAASTALARLHVGAGSDGDIGRIDIVDGGVASGGTLVVTVTGGTPSSSFTETINGGTASVGGTGQPLNGGAPINSTPGSGGYEGGTPSSVMSGVLDGGTAAGGSSGGSGDPIPTGAVIEIGCSGSGYLFLSELVLYGGDEDKGIMVHGVGHAGYKASDFAVQATKPAAWRSAIANLEPDVIIIELGMNDAAANSAAAFRTNLLALVAAIRSIGGPIPTVPILLASPYNAEASGLFVDPWANYVAEQRYVANTDILIAFLNEAERMPDTNSLANFALYHSDHIHGNANGKAYSMQAQIMAEALSFG